MKHFLFIIVSVFILTSVCDAFPMRKYNEGDILYYRMSGINDGRVYEAISRHKVICENNVYFEKISWISLTYEGISIDISELKDFHPKMSLDKNFSTSITEMKNIPPHLMRYVLGPFLDMMTFYVDLNPRLFETHVEAVDSGKKVYIPYNKPSSWSDGNYVMLGESTIDFKVYFQKLNERKSHLRVEHVPPSENIHVNFPESWMKDRVTKENNNWIQINKIPNTKKYRVAYGVEYFDVHIFIDNEDGKILSATMYNPVEVMNCMADSIEYENGIIKSVHRSTKPLYHHTYRDIRIELMKTF